MAQFPAPAEGIALTHFVVASDVARSRRFYADVLGGEVLKDGEPTIIALANSWIVINAGGAAHRRQADGHARAARVTPTGSAASSTSASPTFMPSTRNGGAAGPSS